jgi:hypothetical protein
MVLDVNEIVCGDPMCAPVDTVFTMVWPSGGKGMFALPLMASEVLEEDLRYNFPVSFPSASIESGSIDTSSSPEQLNTKFMLLSYVAKHLTV